MKPYAENRKARHDYENLKLFEAGLELTGQEVKSIREGGAKLLGSYVRFVAGQLWLIGAHIPQYSKSAADPSYDVSRSRRLLVTRKELQELSEKVQQKGLTLVPFSLYPVRRRIKLSFGLCRGRKAHDKRDKLKQRDLDRAARRFLRGHDE